MTVARPKKMIFAGILISIVFVVLGTVWLSLSVETFDEIAELLGASESPVWSPPIPDYEIPGLEGNVGTNIAVGIVFTLAVFGVVLAVGRFLSPSRRA